MQNINQRWKLRPYTSKIMISNSFRIVKNFEYSWRFSCYSVKGKTKNLSGQFATIAITEAIKIRQDTKDSGFVGGGEVVSKLARYRTLNFGKTGKTNNLSSIKINLSEKHNKIDIWLHEDWSFKRSFSQGMPCYT